MTENYQPPKHTLMHVGQYEGETAIFVGGMIITPEQARSLGLALMENGLHLMNLAKERERLAESEAKKARRDEVEAAARDTEGREAEEHKREDVEDEVHDVAPL